MDLKRFGSKLVVRIDKGEEIVETIKQICEEQKITLGSVSGIGAINKAKIGLFKPATKEYLSTELEGDYEITNLTGNISTMNGEVYLHLHITISDVNYNAFGGHLNIAVVSATSEIVIDVIEGQIDRAFNEEIGLNLIKF